MRMTTFRTAALIAASAIMSVPVFATTYLQVTYPGYVPTTETLVGTMSPSDSVTNITDISGIIGGKSFAASLKGTPYSRVDVASADGDTKLVVQFKQYESPYVKCVVVEFTKDASGGIYAKAVKAAYIAYNNMNFDFSQNSGYSGSTVSTADDAAAYGVKGLSFTIPLDSSLTFDSTTTTDLNEPTGWACGYVPVGKNVIISGAGVTGVLSSSTPAFASVTVQNGATLSLGDGVTAPYVSLVGSATLSVASGATATLANSIKGIVEAQDVPAISIPSGATLNVPGGATFGNVAMSVGGTLAATTAGDLTLGYAGPNETATFGLMVNGGTISTTSGNICFFYPGSGGMVTPLGTVTFTGATFSHDDSHGFNIGVNNPDAIAVTFVFDNTTLNYPKKNYYTISGGSALRFVNGGRLYRANSQNDKFTLTVSGLASIFLGDGTSSLIGESSNSGGSVGSGAMTFNPSTDGHVMLVLSNAVWETYHADGKSKAVAEIYGSSVHTINQNNYNRAQPFNAFKAVNLNAGATLTIGNNIDVSSINFTEKFTGPGSLLFTTPKSSTRTFNFKSTTSTATGTLSADAATKAELVIASTAKWDGTIIWNGHASLETTDGTPFAYTFGGIRADTPFTFRLWEGGTCDTVNLTGEGWTGLAEPVISVQGGYDPVPGDRWVLGTIPAGSSVPPLTSSRWVLSTEAIEGDASNVRLVLSTASVDFTFNSTATTDINDPTGWTCGYVPVGEDVLITGRNVRVVLDTANTMPAFTSISIRDGAALEILAANELPAIDMRADTSLVISNAVVSIAGFSGIAPGQGETPASFAIQDGATLLVPGGTCFKNISLDIDHGTVAATTSGDITFGYAASSEAACFGLTVNGGTISNRLGHVQFFCPLSGGTVTPLADVVFTGATFIHDNNGTTGFQFCRNNPSSTTVKFIFDGTTLNYPLLGDYYIAGGANLHFRNGGSLYRADNSGYNNCGLNVTGLARLVFEEGTSSKFGMSARNGGAGDGRIDLSPETDGWVSFVISNACWEAHHHAGNSKAIAEVFGRSAVAVSYQMWNWAQPFNGTKEVHLNSGATLTFTNNVGAESLDFTQKFTGPGSLFFSTPKSSTRNFNFKSTTSTATGTLEADAATKAELVIAPTAKWDGTVVWNGHASLETTEGTPFSYTFGGIRADAPFTFRLWEGGVCDTVNLTGDGWTGLAEPTFALQNGYDPVPGDRWVLGTIPAASSVPPLSSARWLLSTEAIDGDADNVSLVLSVASVDFTFNSTTTTDINDPTGWACGHVPVGESVSITGHNVRVILDATNCIPAFQSITVRDGATLTVSETNSLPAIELRPGASLVVDGATAVITTLSTIAPGEGESLPGISILNGGTAVVPGGMGFKNISLRMEGGTLVNDGSGPLYLGTAIANESTVFGLSAVDSAIATRSNTALYFMSPASGGTVAPLDDLALTNCVVDTGLGRIYFGQNNPTNTPFTVRFHGTDLAIVPADGESAITFAGAGTVALDGGARFYRPSPWNGQNGAFEPTFTGRGRLTITGTNTNSPADFRLPFAGNGDSAIVSKPDEDGFATIEFTNTRAWIWRPTSNHNSKSNGKAVWKVADTSFAFGMLYWWGQQQVPFLGLKAVEIANGSSLTLERRKLGNPWDFGDTSVGGGSEDASGGYTIRLADVPFTGGGSVIVTNTYNRNFHVLVSCDDNTATGTIAAYDTSVAHAGKTKILFNDGANWAGTVVASDNIALVRNASDNLNNNFSDSGNPATVSFGGVRFDGNLTLRLWADGSADKVNFGDLGFAGSGGIAFAFPDGAEPQGGNKWVIGTKPKSVPVPPVSARLWRISAKALDETTDQLIASPVTGLFILVQ